MSVPNGPAVPKDRVGTRKDLRSLPDAEQERYVNAVKRMMSPDWATDLHEDQVGKGKAFPSEYLRLAGYHGWPAAYCAHGIETFPNWHRAYMTDFEQTLQAADLANRKDQGLPAPEPGQYLAAHYWGWDAAPNDEVHDLVFPKFITDGKTLDEMWAIVKPGIEAMRVQYPISDPDEQQSYDYMVQNGYEINTPDEFEAEVDSSNLRGGLQTALKLTVYSQFSNHTGAGHFYSLEHSHDYIHNDAGGIVTDPTIAAYHPLFWLHHSNVDRLLEAWDKARTKYSPMLQFESGNKVLFNAALKPFKHPADPKLIMTPLYTYQDITALGYVYGELPPVPPAVPIQPTAVEPGKFFVVFKDIDPTQARTSYNIYVFILPKSKESELAVPAKAMDFKAQTQPAGAFAGSTSLFASKGPGCQTCRSAGTFNLAVEVTDTLTRNQGMGIITSEAVIKVVVEKASTRERFDNFNLNNYHLTGLPEPELIRRA